MGSREGKIPVSAIAGPLLFTELKFALPQRPGRRAMAVKPQRHQARPGYDDKRLAEALREGEDPLDRPLHTLMPRYQLDDAALRALTAYLRQLSSAPPPGVQGTTMHLATIVAPDADEVRTNAVVDTLQAWAGQKTPGAMLTQLHVWRLQGPEQGWGEQLERYYREQPVYAVLSGAGKSRWEPVQAFCERTALPCLFPILDRAPDSTDSYYSMYFSAGVRLEAQMLARYLADLPERPARIVQLVADETGSAAAKQLQEVWGEGKTAIQAWSETDPSAASPHLDKRDVLIAWLNAPQLNALSKAMPQLPGAGRLLLSGQLAPPDKTVIPDDWKTHVQWMSARSDPAHLRGHTVLGLIPWLEKLHVPLTDEVSQSDVYGAVFFFTDAQARMRGVPNRDYLLEMLETTVDDRPAAASYYHLSLGPGQRLAAKNGHLLGYADQGSQRVTPIGPRIAP
jgi:hypothetical protein